MTDWYPGGGGLHTAAPEYPGVPVIAIVDSIKQALPLLKRKKWTTLRNNALEKWIPSGLSFVVSVGPMPDPHYPWNPGTITLSIGETVSSYDAGGVGGYVASEHAGYAVFELTSLRFRRDERAKTAAHVAHEVGHALGFGHGGNGVMGGNWQATSEEIDALHDYYLGA